MMDDDDDGGDGNGDDDDDDDVFGLTGKRTPPCRSSFGTRPMSAHAPIHGMAKIAIIQAPRRPPAPPSRRPPRRREIPPRPWGQDNASMLR